MTMRRPTITIALGAAAALAAASGADASGVVTPPAGTPNLAQMAIQPTDLVPGAVPGSQAYVRPPTGFTAQYGSDFTTASTPDGVSYSLVLDFVALAPDASTASNLFTEQQAFDESRKGHKLITKQIIKAAGKKGHLEAKNVKFTAAQTAGVGTGSFEETITVSHKHASFQEVVLFFEEGDIVASLELVGDINSAVPEADATTLANAMNTHITTVLAASGATGASGAT
jgi:hypothetical protein